MLAQEKTPPSWAIVRAGDVIDVRDGTHDSPKPVDIGMPLVTSKNLVGGRIDFDSCSFISEADHKKISQRSAVDDGDILYAMIGTIGNPVLVEKTREFSIKNVALFKFSGHRVYNRFFLHFLQSDNVKRQFQKKARGGTQKFVSLGNIRGLEVPLPSLPEQRRIAAILDKADELRQKRRQAIEKLDQLLQSVFLDMFGDPVTNPKGWTTGAISQSVLKTKSGASIQPTDFSSEGFPVLHKGAIKPYGSISLDIGKKTFVSEAFAKTKSNSIVDQNAVVVTLRDLVPSGPAIGLAASLTSECYTEFLLSQGVYALHFDMNKIDPGYFVYITNSASFRALIKRYCVGSTQIHIRNPVYLGLKIPYPPIELQRRFSSLLRQKNKLICHLNFSKSELDTLFYSLQQRAFSGTL